MGYAMVGSWGDTSNAIKSQSRQEVEHPLVIDEDVKSWEGGADDNPDCVLTKFLVDWNC